MQQNHSEEAFLPAFCSPTAVFFVVLIGELVALFVALALSRLPAFNWQVLGAASLYIQWVGLCSAGLLCSLRTRLQYWSLRSQILFVYVTVLLVAAVCSVLAAYLLGGLDAVVWQVARDVLLAAIVAGIGLRYFVLQHLHQLQKQAELSSRVEVLQARIRPHFMFNTLNAIASVIHVDQNKAEAMILDFADLIRSAMQQPALVPLLKELELCRQYAALEQMRFGEKLRFNWHIEAEAEAVQVPNLLLQPLIENAIYHGIQGRADGGEIQVSASINEAALILTVRNPLADTTFQAVSGQQLALKNIKHRLALLYADKAKIRQQLTADDFVISISLPIEAEA